MNRSIKIIDLFAGPGGLGEGFSAFEVNGVRPFRIAVSVEKESSAHKTLTLRAFFRQFELGKAPEDYYRYLRGELSREALFERWPSQAATANEETLAGPRALGEDNDLIDQAIEKALGRNCSPWVLIGGPPCQAYSLVGRARNKGVAGYRPEADHRHFLYREYLRILARYRPAVFVMENVKGILSSSVGGVGIFEHVLGDLRAPFRSLGDNASGPTYRIYSLVKKVAGDSLHSAFSPSDFIIRAENFGIPQTRHRVILLGLREDLCAPNGSPVLETSASPTLKTLIGSMPALRSGLSKEADNPSNWMEALGEAANQICKQTGEPPVNQKLKAKLESAAYSRRIPLADRGARFLAFRNGYDPKAGLPEKYGRWYTDPKLGGWLNHETRGHIRADLARYLYFIAQAQVHHYRNYSNVKLRDLPELLQPNHANRRSGHFSDRFKVQLPHGPASTITSHISKDGHYFIHYDLQQCRSFTVREAARVQTFPDNYFFEGSRTQQYVQVGNAVPPLLAEQIARIISSVLGLAPQGIR